MATTARQIIRSALRKLGAISKGQTVDPTEEADALDALNQLLSSFSNKSLLIPVTTKVTTALVVGTSTYNIGTGQTINTTKPDEILTAIYQDTSGSSPLDYEIDIVDRDFFQAYTDKSFGGISTRLWFNNNKNSSTASISLYPTPSVAGNIVLYVRQPLTQITNLTANIPMNDMYSLMLTTSLAAILAPEYGLTETQNFASLKQDAITLQREIKRSGFIMPKASIDTVALNGRFPVTSRQGY